MENGISIEEKNQVIAASYFSMNDEGRDVLDTFVQELTESCDKTLKIAEMKTY